MKDYRATGAILGLPYYLALRAEALHLADRTSEALEAINEAVAIAERFEHGDCSQPNCTGSAVCFSRRWVLMKPKLKLHFSKP